jgi:hypothetical protein
VETLRAAKQRWPPHTPVPMYQDIQKECFWALFLKKG